MQRKRLNLGVGGCEGGFYIIPMPVAVNKTLSSSSKKVLSYILSLWNCCEEVHPSTEKIMEATFSTKSSVLRARDQLVELGLISIEHRGTGRGDANVYMVNENNVNNFLGTELLNTTRPQETNDKKISKNGNKKLN